MCILPRLPKGVTWDDVEIISRPGTEENSLFEEEPPVVARNKKTGEIYE